MGYFRLVVNSSELGIEGLGIRKLEDVLKVKYRGMYIQKRAKMLLFAVTNIIAGSYEVTFW